MTALLLALALALPQEKPGATEKGKVQERVTVDRVVVTGRVLDQFANPIAGLAARDFRLRVDGRETAIESIEWSPGRRQPEQKPAPAQAPPAQTARTEEPALAPPPRLTVMLFQCEIAGQKDVGVVRMMRQAKRFVDSAQAEDRIAVFG